MSDSTADRDPIEMLADSFLARFRRGERPSVEEYAAKYPHLAHEIRELLPALVMLEQGKSAVRLLSGTNRGPDAAASGSAPRQLGDYLILREIGRGGMGVVYESVQQSLGRHVALKVLPRHALAGSSQLERFRLEARAAARLHHTNIVPVFGVGECEGVHYYAMQFIQGQALDLVIDALRGLRNGAGPASEAGSETPGTAGGDDQPLTTVLTQALLMGRFAAPQPELEPRPEPTDAMAESLTPAPSQGPAGAATSDRASGLPPTDVGRSSELSSAQAGVPYFRSVARVGVQVAEALAHAHGQGILHRDIKPSNLLLDAKGTVWVTDFGLAKAEGSDGLTRTGDIVGTLHYMAPERFDGWSDPRSDVYALGATLYELLTLRPPFRESDRVKLIEQVLHEEPLPPHRLDRRIPRDLETIVLKALSKEPGQRYTTAEQMAEDLRRFAADRPILARRISPAERTWRWCKRNPMLAGAAGAVAVALVAVTVLAVQYADRQRHFGVEQAKATQKIGNLAMDLAKERQSLRKSLDESYRLLAIRNFEHGQAAFEQGEIALGMLWMIESWRSAADAGDPAWQHAARANLAAWRAHYPRLKMVLSHAMPVHAAAFSPDGRTVISGSMDGTAQLWDTATGQKIGSPLRQGGDWIQVGFSPDGKIALTCSIGKPARLWDAVTGQPIGPTLTRPRDDVFGPAFSPDGRIVITPRADGKAQLCDVATGLPIGRPLKHEGSFRCAAFSPDGRTILTGGSNGTARLWDAATREPLGPPMRHDTEVTAVAFSPDGKTILTVGKDTGPEAQDRVARLWDAATGLPIGRPLKHEGGFRCAAFSPDSRAILTAGREGPAQLWEAATGKPLGPPMRHENKVWSVAFSPDGKTILTGCMDKQARLWDAATGRCLGPLEHQGAITAVTFSPDGKTILTGSLDGTVRLWDSDPGQPVGRVLEIPSPDDIKDVGLSPDGVVLLSFPRVRWENQRYAQLWNATTGRPIGARLPQPRGDLQACFSVDGKVLLTIEGGQTAQLWDAATGASLGPVFPLPSPLRIVDGSLYCLGPDGKTVLFVDTDQRFWICDGATGTVRGRTPALGAIPYMANFSPDGKTFVTGLGNGEAQLWDAATLKPLGDPIRNPGSIVSGLFSPDGKSILIAHEDGSVRLFDLATRKPLIAPLRHQSGVEGLAFSPDGKTIATGSEDKNVRLWDSATGQPIGPILRHNLPVGFVAFLDDGKSLYTGRREYRLFAVPGDLPNEVERMAAWVEVITGLRLDKQQALIQVLDNTAWLERRQQLMELGGPPETSPDQRLDPILFGPEPTARAKSFMERRQWDAAEAAFDEAMRARPFNVAIVEERGDLYVRRGLWKEAAAYFARAVGHYPDVASLHYQLAIARLLAGDLPGYRSACTAMFERFNTADDLLAANRLAFAGTYAPDALTNLPALIRVCERSVPAVAGGERVVGAALYRAARYEQALERFQQSHKVFQPRAWDWLFLAMIHSRLGHPSEAHRFLQQADEWITEADRAPSLTPSPTEKEGRDWMNLTERPTILILRREAEAVIRSDPVFPADPFAR
jgi:eukaryotic-like serine/threonine-protein kinase